MTSSQYQFAADQWREQAHRLRKAHAGEVWNDINTRLLWEAERNAERFEELARRARMKERLFFWRKAG